MAEPIWQPGDRNPRRPPLTEEEVRPRYTEVRLIPSEDLPIAVSDYAGSDPLRWTCLRDGGCGASEVVRTYVAAVNLTVTHRCPAVDDKDPASCAEPSPPSPSPASSPPA